MIVYTVCRTIYHADGGVESCLEYYRSAALPRWWWAAAAATRRTFLTVTLRAAAEFAHRSHVTRHFASFSTRHDTIIILIIL